MGQRFAYDIDSDWDDPFEKAPERRSCQRVPFSIVLSVRVQVVGDPRPLVGPARAEDLSLTGVLALTKHQLHVGQRVMLSIPTEDLGLELGLPTAFVGAADVVRIIPVDGRLIKAAFHFTEALRSNMDLAVYVNALGQIGPVWTDQSGPR